jgi:CheY-like chemotaxis protein
MEILLVEDSPTDVIMTKEAFADTKPVPNLNVVKDGVEALDYLRRVGRYRDARRPDLILLDLNLPRKSGLEVLEEVKSDDALKQIPLLVLSTSKDNHDVNRAYRLHANCFITKPVEFDSFHEIVRAIRQFWFGVATLPRTRG